MRICLIYHVWDDYELLEAAIKNHARLVDGVIVVFSETSNFGEHSPAPLKYGFLGSMGAKNIVRCEPNLNLTPAQNERNKRNFGLQTARELGYTHFLNCDSDEFYDPTEFLKEKERFKNPDLLGTVCRVKTYFKLPTLTIWYDTTLVPFIHKITPDLRFTWNPKYPFAFEGPKREIRIDPTRQMNINTGVEWSEITMHHYSWIRSDIDKKIRNSTARANIEKSTIVEDYVNAREGYYCQFYRARLEACVNRFNVPELLDAKHTGI